MRMEFKAIPMAGNNIPLINQVLRNLSAEGWSLVAVVTVGDTHVAYVQREIKPKYKLGFFSRFMPSFNLT